MTRKRQTQQDSRASTALMHTTFAALPHPFCVIDRQDYTVKVANAAARRDGWITGKRCYQGPHRHHAPCDDRRLPCPVDRVIHTGEPVTVEHIHYDEEGATRYVEIHGAPIFDRHGRITEIIHLSLDITNRKQADWERIRLAEAVEQAADSIIISDAAGIILYLNPSFERITGYARNAWLGKSLRLLLGTNSSRDNFDEIWSTVCHGGSLCANLTLTKNSGDVYQVAATFSAVRDKAGVLSSIVSVQRDITHERDLEEQLLRAQKLEAVGTLAGGIAHDFNNLLSVITGFAELTLERLGETHAKELYNLNQIVAVSSRARDLTQQILTFSKGEPYKSQFVDLAGLVREISRFLQATLPKTIDIQCHINAPMTLTRADPSQIHQVLLNLCTNAAHAMRTQGGTLKITIDEYNVGPYFLARQPSLNPGLYLRIIISDTGEGIAPEVLDRIFDPYFTTKPPGEGTGLGLSVSHEIARKCGGTITVESVHGSGSSFQVMLPRIKDYAESSRPVHCAPSRVSAESILLVDDEPVLAELWGELLEKDGYRVTSLADSQEALTAFQANPRQFDLVIADQDMPAMNGCVLARELVRIRSDIPVLLCTGDTTGTVSEGNTPWIRSIIQKPARREELASLIRSTLDGKNNPCELVGESTVYDCWW